MRFPEDSKCPGRRPKAIKERRLAGPLGLSSHGIKSDNDAALLCEKGLELDFILAHGRDRVDAIECKWDPAAFDPAALKTFRSHYPHGRNFLITPSGAPAHARRFGDLEVTVGGLVDLVQV